jgi:CubicO group peptidase (beta-lactamase class C family)
MTNKSNLHALLLLLLIGVAVNVPSAQSPRSSIQPIQVESKDLAAMLDSFFVAEMEKEHLPGAVFALVKDGKVVYAKGYGVADVEKKTPVTPDKTIFRIGSITKVFTALALTQLAERKKISLNDDVNKYLDQPKVAEKYGEPVRLRHLLTHTAGFDQVGDRERQVADPKDRPSLRDYLAKTLIRIRPPGQVSCYDTWGITLAGYLVEKISGQSYPAYLQKNVFSPLGMTRASVETPEAWKPDLALGYRYRNDQYVRQAYEYYTTTPASSIDATALDMAQFMLAVLGDGKARFLNARTLQQLRQVQFSNAPGFPAYSFGFWEDQRNGQRALYHGGTMDGFLTQLYLVPEHRLGFYVAYNRDQGPGEPPAPLRDLLTRRLMDKFFPVSPVAAEPKPPLPIPTERFAGNYAGNMYCHTCYEGEGWAMFYTPVKAAGAGVLEIDGERWLAVEPLLFQSERGSRRIAFRADASGQITHMISGLTVREKLGERLLDEVLGIGRQTRPVEPLTALVYRTNEQWEKAALAYDALRTRKPQNGRSHYNAGTCWLRAGKPGNALPALERAWELKERPPQTAYTLGVAFALNGEKDRAFEWLEQALKLNAESREALRTDGRLNSLRDDARFKTLIGQ